MGVLISSWLVSLIWKRRAIPLYWSLLPNLGSSNFDEQTTNLRQVLPLFSEDKVIVVLGNGEFCEFDLGNWLKEKGVSFGLIKTQEESLYRNKTFSLATVR
ncbi:hypothetical protein [Microcoleus vaginatus]|uniref:hypothetical protein n=1 Tax=Microcoleus vaginatus TaxID=119532 RepID=UPI001686B818|nr:hypothetical protein [Microcoleus sp. FACHB-DQ6]